MFINNLIILRNISYNYAKKIVRMWIECYTEDYDNLIFELYEIEKDRVIAIKIDNRVEVSSLIFITGCSSLYRRVKESCKIEGFAIGRDPNILEGKELFIYLSTDELEYAVAAVTKDNRHYLIDVDEATEINDSRKYSLPNITLRNPEVIKACDIPQKRPEKNITIRFLVVLSVALVLLLSSLYSYLHAHTYVDTINTLRNWASGIGFGFGFWLYLDYKILQIKKLYIASILIGVLYLAFGTHIMYSDIDVVIHAGVAYPLMIVLTQGIARSIYISKMNAEPSTIDPATTPERVYSSALLLIPIALAIVIMTLL